MSDAWKGPVTLWREPVRGGVFRVGGRLLISFAWLIAGSFVSVVLLRGALWMFSMLALMHAGLAVANLVRGKREVLRLAGSGAIEWRPSLQEEWLRRPVDFVDGRQIIVAAEEKFPIWAPSDPRVLLRGETRVIRGLPLHGATIEDFAATLRKELEPRGIAVLMDGSEEVRELRDRRRAQRAEPIARAKGVKGVKGAERGTTDEASPES